MAHKLGMKFNGEVKELKLGKTFTKGFREEAYHTIRYDFKPASVDSQKVGSLEVVDKEVTLNVPLMGGGGSSQEAVFKGNKTPASKDCLLIIDHTTGEIVLERISQHIRVKKTRAEGNNRKAMQRGMAPDLRPNKPSPSHNHSTSSPHVARPSPNPSHRSPQHKSPNHRPANSTKSQQQQQQQPQPQPQPAAAAAAAPTPSLTPGSMPMLNFEEEQKNDSIMSDSSSDSDSNSGSSSSSDSDSDSDNEPRTDHTTKPTPNNYTSNGHAPRNDLPNNHKSPSSILSDLELSEED